MAFLDHAPRRLLRHMKTTHSIDSDRMRDLRCIKVDDGAACPCPGIEDHDVRRSYRLLDIGKERHHLIRLRHIASEGLRTRLPTKTAQFRRIAGGQCN